jgi:hypothetical protein
VFRELAYVFSGKIEPALPVSCGAKKCAENDKGIAGRTIPAGEEMQPERERVILFLNAVIVEFLLAICQFGRGQCLDDPFL